MRSINKSVSRDEYAEAEQRVIDTFAILQKARQTYDRAEREEKAAKAHLSRVRRAVQKSGWSRE